MAPCRRYCSLSGWKASSPTLTRRETLPTPPELPSARALLLAPLLLTRLGTTVLSVFSRFFVGALKTTCF